MTKRTLTFVVAAFLFVVSFVSFFRTEKLSASPPDDFFFGPQVPLAESFRMTIKGDYVASGVGIRNVGGGTIAISLPSGSVIKKAFLYWAIIRAPGPVAANTGTLNGAAIAGALVGTSGDPCWPTFAAGNFIDVFRADVSAIAHAGNNVLSGFPSGLTNHTPPQDGLTFPLIDGASLVVVFENPLFDLNTVAIRDGAQSFALQSPSTSFGSFVGAPGTAVDEVAKTTFVVADGQAEFAGDRAIFNGAVVAGPGSGVRPLDAFNGADGIASISALDGLWDTLTTNISAMFQPGVPSNAVATIDSTHSLDCLCWVAQVLSTKTAWVGTIDIKPGSFPNSINTKNSGSIPVAILSSSTFSAPDQVDRDSPTFGQTGFEHSLLFCAGVEDVNHDGLPDLVFHFETLLTGFVEGDEVGVLRAKTLSGYDIAAADTVRIVH